MKLGIIPTSSGPVVASEGHNGRLKNYNVAETSGTAVARARLWSGVAVGTPGTELAYVALQAGASINYTFPDSTYKQFIGGIYVEVIAGAIEGSVGWL